MLWAKLITCLLMLVGPAKGWCETSVTVGSKKFTESYILAEVMAQLLEDRGHKVHRRLGLGGTLVAYQALREGAIDVYPEYTGTITQAILHLSKNISGDDINRELSKQGLELLPQFGFNNTYALALPRSLAEKLAVSSISDLKSKNLKAVFSHEFLQRADGWVKLKRAYGLQLSAVGLEHNLAYSALAEGEAQVMEIYTTDAKIQKFELTVLDDDLSFFPKYFAAPLTRENVPISIKQLLTKLSGTISRKTMLELNSQVENEGKTFAQVARQFLLNTELISPSEVGSGSKATATLMSRTRRHLFLTLTAILMAILVAVPVAVLLLRSPTMAQPIMILAGLLQTIPSIALLAFMIPFFGIGVKPAIFGLFLYSILPILRNTYVALSKTDPTLLESARGIGLSPWEILVLVRVPLGLPVILAGVRTAAVISIGTATLAAFIGAGGLGEPIVTGLALNDVALILEGAVPSAILAVITELLFEGLEKLVSPETSFRLRSNKAAIE